MSELYAFLFSLGLGVAARILYIGSTALAKRTNLLPVTFVLDVLTVATVGGAFTLYVIYTGTQLAPCLFAALFSGYLFAYWVTRRTSDKPKKRRTDKRAKKSANTPAEPNAASK